LRKRGKVEGNREGEGEKDEVVGVENKGREM